MMNYIFASMIILSFFCAVSRGSITELSGAIIACTADAVELILKLGGMIIFWSGLTAIAEKSGLTLIIGRLLSPVLKLLFPKLSDEKAKSAISMNITANLLGLGNAATPLGIEAMKRLKAVSPNSDTASDDMIRFVVINSAAVHLVPSTVALLRQQHGSGAPTEILLPSLINSVIALSGGIILTALLKRGKRKKSGSEHSGI